MGRAVIDGHRFVEDEHHWIGPSGQNSGNASQISGNDKLLKCISDSFKGPASSSSNGSEGSIGGLSVAGASRKHHRKRADHQHMA
jgi:hypothetical protein